MAKMEGMNTDATSQISGTAAGHLEQNKSYPGFSEHFREVLKILKNSLVWQTNSWTLLQIKDYATFVLAKVIIKTIRLPSWLVKNARFNFSRTLVNAHHLSRCNSTRIRKSVSDEQNGYLVLFSSFWFHQFLFSLCRLFDCLFCGRNIFTVVSA